MLRAMIHAWHRKGFRLYWGWKIRRRERRPTVRPEIRDLIRQMNAGQKSASRKFVLAQHSLGLAASNREYLPTEPSWLHPCVGHREQSVFEVAFLSMAWSWIAFAVIVLVVTFAEARLGKPIALMYGFAVLIQAVFTVPMVGFFIGNEMIGAASSPIIFGCFLFHGSPVET